MTTTPTDPLELLRQRREEREAAATSEYWRHLARLAAGDLKPQAAAAAVAAVDDAAAAIGKDTIDLEGDLANLRSLRALEPATIAARRAEIDAQRAAADARVRAAGRAIDLAHAENEAAEAARGATNGASASLSEIERQVARLRAALADAHCPADLVA